MPEDWEFQEAVKSVDDVRIRHVFSQEVQSQQYFLNNLWQENYSFSAYIEFVHFL